MSKIKSGHGHRSQSSTSLKSRSLIERDNLRREEYDAKKIAEKEAAKATPRAEKRKNQDVVSPTGLTPELKTNKGECTLENFDNLDLDLSPSKKFCGIVFKFGLCSNEPKELDWITNSFNKLDLLELVEKTNSLIENQQKNNMELLETFELKDPRPSREYANKPVRLEKAKFLPYLASRASNQIQILDPKVKEVQKLNKANYPNFSSHEEEMETEGPGIDALLCSGNLDEEPRTFRTINLPSWKLNVRRLRAKVSL